MVLDDVLSLMYGKSVGRISCWLMSYDPIMKHCNWVFLSSSRNLKDFASISSHFRTLFEARSSKIIFAILECEILDNMFWFQRLHWLCFKIHLARHAATEKRKFLKNNFCAEQLIYYFFPLFAVLCKLCETCASLLILESSRSSQNKFTKKVQNESEIVTLYTTCGNIFILRG